MFPDNDDRFRFTRTERTGLIVLLALLGLLLFCWRVLPQWLAPPAPPNEQLQQAWQTFRTQHLMTATSQQDPNHHVPANHDDHTPPKPFPFDPNRADKATLLALGLPRRTVRTLLHYRAKGGHFYRTEDLKKIYTLSDETYRRIAPYVRIHSAQSDHYHKTATDSHKKTDAKITYRPVPLNRADVAALIALPGIGATFANRIVAYRKLLGGFVALRQLNEVYGLPDSTIQRLKNYFIIDPSYCHKIPVNTATEKQLARHPYIGRQLAKNIILLRQGLGKFKNINQLKQVPLINAEKYRKIAPYLTL